MQCSSTTYIPLPLPANSTSLSIPLDSASTSLSLPIDPSVSLPLESTTTTVNGKQIKVFVKTVLKQTLACEACRARKRRCDGHAPCTFCVSKKQECIFAAAKKRGPSIKKKRVHEDEGSPTDTSLVSAQRESDILDIVEGNRLNDVYSKFVEFILPLSHGDIMKPRTITHKVQSYVALAYIARMSGVKPLAQKYISQARLLSGSIYDRPELDTVAAMMTFAMYWNLISDFTQSSFYCDMACAIIKMVPAKSARGKLGIFITNLRLCSDPNLKKDPELLSLAFKRVLEDLSDTWVVEDVICKAFMKLTAETLSVLHYNILGDTEVIKKGFSAFDNINVSEEGRRRIQKSVAEIHTIAKMFAAALIAGGSYVLLVFDVECPLYEMVVAIKSGHAQDALEYAWTLLRALQNLQAKNALAIITKITTIFMLGSGCRLLHQIGYTNLAIQIFEYVQMVCKQMDPEYNYILSGTEFATDGSPVTNRLFGLPDHVRSNIPVLSNVTPANPFPSQLLITGKDYPKITSSGTQITNPDNFDRQFTNAETSTFLHTISLSPHSDSSRNSSPSSTPLPSPLLPSPPLPSPPLSSPLSTDSPPLICTTPSQPTPFFATSSSPSPSQPSPIASSNVYQNRNAFHPPPQSLSTQPLSQSLPTQPLSQSLPTHSQPLTTNPQSQPTQSLPLSQLLPNPPQPLSDHPQFLTNHSQPFPNPSQPQTHSQPHSQPVQAHSQPPPTPQPHSTHAQPLSTHSHHLRTPSLHLPTHSLPYQPSLPHSQPSTTSAFYHPQPPQSPFNHTQPPLSFDLSQPPETPLSQTYALNASNGISFEAIENHDLEDILQQLNS